VVRGPWFVTVTVTVTVRKEVKAAKGTEMIQENAQVTSIAPAARVPPSRRSLSGKNRPSATVQFYESSLPRWGEG
jgi:hypothetical protein